MAAFGGQVPVVLLLGAILLVGCGGEPPRGLGGVELGMTQQEVLDAAGARGGFVCRLRGSRPKLTVCEGPVHEGRLTVTMWDDTVAHLGLGVGVSAGGGEAARREVRRFVEPLGDPAWRDRPRPPPPAPPDGYHTLWLDGDSTRALALVCAGRRLEPPCTAELTRTTPAGVEAQLDSLLGIRR